MMYVDADGAVSTSTHRILQKRGRHPRAATNGMDSKDCAPHLRLSIRVSRPEPTCRNRGASSTIEISASKQGCPSSSLRGRSRKERPFRTLKFHNRPSARSAIQPHQTQGSTCMTADGLAFRREARKVYPMRSLNSLNTVDSKKCLHHLDGEFGYRRSGPHQEKHPGYMPRNSSHGSNATRR